MVNNELHRLEEFHKELLSELEFKSEFVNDSKDALIVLERITSKFKKNYQVSQIANADYLLAFFFALNNESLRSFNEANIIINSFKNEINSWNIEKDGRDLTKVIDYLEVATEDDKNTIIDYNPIKSEIDRLHIPYNFLNHKILWSLRALYNLIEYKNILEYIEKHNQSKKSIKEIISEQTKNSALFAFNDAMNTFYESFKANLIINENNLKSIEKIINSIEMGEINKLTIIPSEFENLTKKTLEPFLYYLHDKLREDFNELFLENKRLKQSVNETPFKSYLFQLEINYESIDKSLISYIENNKTEEAIAIIKILRNLGISYYKIFNDYKSLFYEWNFDEINDINFYISTKALKTPFIKENLFKIKNYLPQIKANYQVLYSIISFENIYYEEKILLKPLTELKDMLSVLSQYNLTKHNYLYLLSNYHHLYIYDLMLEHNIPLYLLISICKTKNPLNTLKKIIISKQIGFTFETEGHTLEKGIAHENRFLVPDSELDNYLFNLVPEYLITPIEGTKIDLELLKNEYIEKFEKLCSNDCYIIGNTKISRPKFLKNIQYIKDHNLDIENYLSICLMSNSILDNKAIYDILSINELTFTKK